MSAVSFERLQKQWESFIGQYLLPIVVECNEPLEGNILTHHESFYKNDAFVNKQINIHALLSSLQNLEQETIFGLEIGFNSGFSALLMLMSNPKLYLLCVDINSHSYTVPCFEVLKSFFGDRIQLIAMSSLEALPKLIERQAKFDFIYINGSHETEVVVQDIHNCMTCSKPRTLVVMDDTDWDNINQAWSQAIQQYQLKDYIVPGTVECKQHNYKIV